MQPSPAEYSLIFRAVAYVGFSLFLAAGCFFFFFFPPNELYMQFLWQNPSACWYNNSRGCLEWPHWFSFQSCCLFCALVGQPSGTVLRWTGCPGRMEEARWQGNHRCGEVLRCSLWVASASATGETGAGLAAWKQGWREEAAEEGGGWLRPSLNPRNRRSFPVPPVST